MPNYTLQTPCKHRNNTVIRSAKSRSPLREMIAHGRLTDLLEFLSNYYGMQGDEALAILGRFSRA